MANQLFQHTPDGLHDVNVTQPVSMKRYIDTIYLLDLPIRGIQSHSQDVYFGLFEQLCSRLVFEYVFSELTFEVRSGDFHQRRDVVAYRPRGGRLPIQLGDLALLNVT